MKCIEMALKMIVNSKRGDVYIKDAIELATALIQESGLTPPEVGQPIEAWYMSQMDKITVFDFARSCKCYLEGEAYTISQGETVSEECHEQRKKLIEVSKTVVVV